MPKRDSGGDAVTVQGRIVDLAVRSSSAYRFPPLAFLTGVMDTLISICILFFRRRMGYDSLHFLGCARLCRDSPLGISGCHLLPQEWYSAQTGLDFVRVSAIFTNVYPPLLVCGQRPFQEMHCRLFLLAPGSFRGESSLLEV